MRNFINRTLHLYKEAKCAFITSKKRKINEPPITMRCVITKFSTLYFIGDVIGNDNSFQHLYNIERVQDKIVISTCSYLSFCSKNGYEITPCYVSFEEGTVLEALFKRTEHYQEIVNSLNNVNDLLLRRQDLFKLCSVTNILQNV